MHERLFDCLVLGRGIIGTTIALRLRQRGLHVALVDPGLGDAASLRAAGILAPQAEAEVPGPLFTLSVRSRALYPALLEELAGAAEVGYRTEGTLLVAASEAEVARLEARRRWQCGGGLRAEWLTAAEVAEREPSLSRCEGALLLPDDHQLEPPRLLAAVAAAARRAGVVERAERALRIVHDGQRALGVDLETTRLTCDRIVVACGSWSGLVEGVGLGDALVPVRGQLVELKLPEPRLSHVVFGQGGYLVPRTDGRVHVGSTEERVGFVATATAAGTRTLCERAERLSRALGEARFVGTSAGLRPTTADRLPLLGSTALTGLFLATGHYRHGVLLAPATAMALSAMVTEDTAALAELGDLRPFHPLRSPPPAAHAGEASNLQPPTSESGAA